MKKINLNYLIFSFFMISISCWGLEVFYSLITRDKLVYPGSWYGPYCPIYGFTFVLLLLICNKQENILINIIKVFITVAVMEYFISFISEQIFNDTIWDYSKDFLNINGRICLKMSIIFTVLGLFLIYVIDPLLKKIYKYLSKKIIIFNFILVVIFIIDIIFTLMK